MKMFSDRPASTALLTLLAPISWGTTYVVVTELLPDGRPLLISASRILPAGILLALFALLAQRWRPQGPEWRHTAVLALFNFALFFPLLVVAIYRLPGGVAAAHGGLQPLLVLGLTALLAGERPRRSDVLVGVFAAVGVAMVVLRPGFGVDPVGVAAAVAANVSFAIGVVMTKRLPAPRSRIGSTGWQMLLASIVVVPIALLVEGPIPVIDGPGLLGFAYLGLLATGLAFIVWFRGIRKLPVVAPPLLGLAAPLVGAALGWALLGEALSIVQVAGFAVTVSAITYGAVAGSRPATLPSPIRERQLSRAA